MHSLTAHPFTEAQIRQLQWVLPTPFSLEFSAFFRRVKTAGAKLRFQARGGEHWIGVFELERMVDEALRCPPMILARFPRLLPFAGCGRRRAAVYWVDVVDLQVWQIEMGGEAQNLGLTLEQLWTSAAFEPRVVVRRRLPSRPSKTTPHKSRAEPTSRPRAMPPCARTLSLFPA